jgi:alpha-tubulin suppressor-like RCC1 family protein
MALIAPVRAITLFLLSWLVGSAAAGNLLLNRGVESAAATGMRSSAPQDVLKVSVAALAVAAGYERTYEVTSTGGALCWGDNEGGALGNSAYIVDTLPNPVVGLSSGVTAIASGPSSDHTCAITSASGLVCWGINSSGELGNGTIAPSTVPAPVTGLTSGVKAVATGGYHTCALTAAAQVFCWGDDTWGQLGDGGKGYYTDLPRPVVGLSSAVATIAAGLGHTCAVTVSGGVWCWGANDYGQLGNGTTTDSSVPVAVAGLSSGVVAIAAGYYHTCAA